MDNHSTHKAITTDVQVLFTPVADPEANPVEIIFSKIKHWFRKFNVEHPEVSVENAIDQAIATLTSSDLSGAISHVHHYVNTTYVSSASTTP